MLGIRGNHIDRPIANFHLWPLGMWVLVRRLGGSTGRQAGRTLRENGFQSLHRLLVGSTANISRSVVVIIGEHTTDLTIVQDARGPVVLVTIQIVFLLRPTESVTLDTK